MKKIFLFGIALLVSLTIHAQVAINTTGAAPAASAMLDVSSTNKGVLIPQVSIDSLKDITSIPNPANGLIVYNTTVQGARNDMQRGYYYYSTTALSWVRLSDNLTDNVWQNGGLLGIQLRDKNNGIEMMDNYNGATLNFSPKVKILKIVDSVLLNAKNNIPALVLAGVNRKPNAGWEFRQKTTLMFESNYILSQNNTSGSSQVAAISGYTENPGTTQPSDNRYNGLAFYTFATPQNTAVADTPSMSMLRHNVGIGAYATDINNVTEGRLQITGFSNGDQLSLRHPSSINLKWGLYVSSIDSSLNLYSNGSLRANIDRVTGIYTALSDRTKKKNIRPLNPVLDVLKKLPVYSYNYSDSKDTDHRVIGVMAQDVQPYFPELVYQRYDREITKPLLTLDYSGMGVLAVKAIQEQQLQIEELQKENRALNDQIQAIMSRLKALEEK
ncbi:MAG: tail fiber domain-containing protein [Ferruginibacter sp.]